MMIISTLKPRNIIGIEIVMRSDAPLLPSDVPPFIEVFCAMIWKRYSVPFERKEYEFCVSRSATLLLFLYKLKELKLLLTA
jgi:hypothetical protein